jgi:RNA-binding protein
VVSIGNNGVSAAVLNELERALADHELIKVRIHDDDRERRQETATAVLAASHAELIQTIGKIIVLYRANPDADPGLSNVIRSGVKLG